MVIVLCLTIFNNVICQVPCYMVDIPPTTLPTNIFVGPVNRFEVLMAVTVSNVIHSDILCSSATLSTRSTAWVTHAECKNRRSSRLIHT